MYYIATALVSVYNVKNDKFENEWKEKFPSISEKFIYNNGILCYKNEKFQDFYFFFCKFCQLQQNFVSRSPLRIHEY